MMGCAVVLAWTVLTADVEPAPEPPSAEQRSGPVAEDSAALETDDRPAPAATAAYHAETRAAIDKVLAQREFADLHGDPYATSRRIWQWFSGILHSISSAMRKLPDWGFWLITIWMLLTLLAILAHLIYSTVLLLRGGWGRAPGSTSARGRPGELLGIQDLDFDSVYAEARRLLGADDWPAATRYLYVAAILALDRQGVIAFHRSKTNRDYVEELTPRKQLQGPFRTLTACFESIVYGGRPPTMATSQDMATTVESLLHGMATAVAG